MINLTKDQLSLIQAYLILGGGQRIDSGTGCLHKAQMIWNLLASLELELSDKQ